MGLKDIILKRRDSVGARHEAHLRNLVKRLRRKQHSLTIMIAVLGEDPQFATALQAASKADLSAADFRKACAACVLVAQPIGEELPIAFSGPMA